MSEGSAADVARRAVDAGMALALSARYFKASTATLAWSIVALTLLGQLRPWGGVAALLAAMLVGHLARRDERLRQRKLGCAAGSEATQDAPQSGAEEG